MPEPYWSRDEIEIYHGDNTAIAYALSLSQDPCPTPDYQVIRTPDDFTAYIPESWAEDGNVDRPIIACDTESLPNGDPYCLTFSHTPGTGRLIYASDQDGLRRFRNIRRAFDPLLLFHNYLHDIVPFEQWQIPVPRFRDTMVMAYNLCLGGGGDDDQSESRAGRGFLGLKILAYRELNMVMASFEDTVHPWSLPHMMQWLGQGEALLSPVLEVATCQCACPRTSHLPRGKTGKTMGACTTCQCPRYKARKPIKDPGDKRYELLHRKIHGLIRDVREGKVDKDGNPTDPWKRVNKWEPINMWGHPVDLVTLVEALGDMPVPSIAHVPEPELLQYAVRDADATLRLYHHLRHLKPWIFWK